MTDMLAWTEDGLAALAKERARLQACRDTSREALRDRVEAMFARYLPAWRRGVKRGAPIGELTVAHVERAWSAGATPTEITVDEAAGLVSLVGSRSDGDLAALAELVIRDHGLRFVIDVLVRAWSIASDYHDPDYPDEARLAIYLREMDGADRSAQDVSVSHAKGDLAVYLGAWCRAATDAERGELAAAVAAAWDAAPLHARPALAVAACDRPRAEQLVRELARGAPWQPRFAWDELPYVVGDVALLETMDFIAGGRMTVRLLEHFGPPLLLIYERKLAARLGAHERASIVLQLVNLRGPRAARLLARFAEKAPTAAAVRAYFARSPELFDLVQGDAALAKQHAKQLAALAKRLATKVAPKGKAKAGSKPGARPR